MTLELATRSAVSRKLATSLAGWLAIFVGGMVLVGWVLDLWRTSHRPSAPRGGGA